MSRKPFLFFLALPELPAGSLPCGFNGTIAESPATIVTPGWPVSYRNFENCEWMLHTNTSGSVLEVVFQSFYTENTFDYLSVSKFFILIRTITVNSKHCLFTPQFFASLCN